MDILIRGCTSQLHYCFNTEIRLITDMCGIDTETLLDIFGCVKELKLSRDCTSDWVNLVYPPGGTLPFGDPRAADLQVEQARQTGIPRKTLQDRL